MADPVLTPRWYLQPGAWPYWLTNTLAAFAAPGDDSSIQNSRQPASNSGILGLLTQPGASLDQSKVGGSGLPPVSGGILGMLTASPEAQTSSIPYWLQTAGHFGFGLGRPLPMSDAPQAASTPRWDPPAASTLSMLPSALFDSSTPYWLRTALPPGANSEGFEVAGRSSEKPSNPVSQLWPAGSEDATTSSTQALLPGFSRSANEDDRASWQEPVSVSPARDSAFAPAFPAPGISPRTPNYRPQLDDMSAHARQADRSPTAADPEHFALSDTSPVTPSAPPADRQWMSGGTSAESDPRVVSDVTPDDDWRPGARYAARARRGSGPRPELELGQANRLFEAQTRAESLIARVRAIDPKWRPRPSAYESVEGLIRAYESDAEQAQARLQELAAPLPPIIPRERPVTASERNDIARAAARWHMQNRGQVTEGPEWFSEYEPSVRAYLDPPRTLPELQQAVTTRQPGYDIHHIVEQTSAEQDGFPPWMINAPENLVRIPRFKHWEINAWYGRPNEDFGGSSPRDYLRGRDWSERVRIGWDALIKYKVLKP